VAVAGEHPDALALALDDQAIVIALDLVGLVRAREDLGSTSRNARFKQAFWHVIQTRVASDLRSRLRITTS
jgi:hypothetical protein